MSLTKIGSIGINTGIQFAGVTTIATLNSSSNVLSVGGTVNFNSDVSIGGSVSIGGTLTYEDVTNIDSVGLITARNGIVVGSGITLSKDGDIFATGVTTATTFVGALTGNVTGNISGGTVAGSTGTFTGDVDIADKIVHTGDTNTAIRFPSADTITAETGGSERFRVDSGGRVSIGNNPTTHADYILHIEDSGETNIKIEGSTSTLGARISLQNNDATANSYSQFAFNDAGGQSTSAIQGINTDNDNNYGELAFLTRSAQGSPPAERVRIDKDGNIGVGVETPSAKLDVRLGGTGTIAEFRGADTDLLHIDGDSNQITLDARNVGSLGFEMQGSAAMTIDSSRRLLVGDTTSDTGLLLLNKDITAESDASDTANYHLVIKSQSNSNTSKVGIAFKNTSDTTTVGASILHHRTAGGSVGDLGFYTSPSDGTTTERLRIASDGVIHVASPDSASGGRIWANSSALYLQSGNGRQTLKVSDAASGVNRTIELTSAGNLAFPSGNGIDFSATGDGSGTDSSELFDDYEEGTWIPTLTNGFTYTTYDATYTKIGNVVNIYCYLYRDDDNTRSSEFQVTNFPYAMDTNYVSSQGLGLASSYAGNTNRKTGIINSANTTYVSIIKSGTTQNVSYDNFVDHQRSVILKWWYYAA